MSMQQKLLDQSMQQGLGKGRVEEGRNNWGGWMEMKIVTTAFALIIRGVQKYIKLFWWYTVNYCR